MFPLSIGRQKSVRAVEKAYSTQKLLMVVTQKSPRIEDPRENDLYPVGVVCEILQFLKLPDGTNKILIEGVKRAYWRNFTLNPAGYIEVDIEEFREEPMVISGIELEALKRELRSLFEQYVKLVKKLPFELINVVSTIEDPLRLVDTIASNLLLKVQDKEKILESPSIENRLRATIQLLTAEIEILNLEKKIQSQVKAQIERTQKEYYLTEQMKAIQRELKQKDDFAKELDEMREKIKQAKMPKETEEVAMRELQRLAKMMPYSPEATVVRTYLEWLISLPWSVETKDNYDIVRAEKILDEDHYGLKKVKERVLEYLAVLKMVKKIKGPILCFVGPPGTGKTSVAKSIARALGRSFVRISLGGVRDEAEIRGHRRTYIGALPGRIIQSMRKAKSKNPVFLLDEIDKMGTDWRGDPAAALLEVLDPEQNHTFVDHYLDVEFDLSKVMFITTANTLYSIPRSLADRLEIIRFPGYTADEKLQIARQFLIPKQAKEHGLDEKKFEVTNEAIKVLIHEYTREAGVRNLERQIANICRKVAKEIAKGKFKDEKITITKNLLKKLIGKPEFHREKVSPNDVGIATGLAWTEHGGETLTIEVAIFKGRGNFTITGQLGDVMQESAKAALSYIRSISEELKVKPEVFRMNDFHIHVPEGAVPKDGPSAGLAIACALASVVTSRPVKKEIAMTGEITLRGRVLPIGGFKEKVLAAHREGIKMVIYPEGNKKDLDEIPKDVMKELKLVPVKRIDEMLNLALEEKPIPIPKAIQYIHPTQIA
jgi:ATP-dependent Lon protease